MFICSSINSSDFNEKSFKQSKIKISIIFSISIKDINLLEVVVLLASTIEFAKSKLESHLGEILVPTHEVTEVKKGKRSKKEISAAKSF